MGADCSYPVYDAYPPTQAVLCALGNKAMKVLHYPSSFGLETPRQAFQGFMHSTFSAGLKWESEIMFNTGVSQALSRAFQGRFRAIIRAYS